MKFIQCFLLLATLFLSGTQVSFGKEKLADPLFQTAFPSPTLVRFCAEKVWAYSVDRNELCSLDPLTGKILTRASISDILPGQLLTALACTKSSLVVAAIRKYDGTEKLVKPIFSLYQMSLPQGDGHLQKPEKLPLPEDAIVRDLETSKDAFFLVQDSVYKSTDLNHWNKLQLALSKDVPPKDVDMVKNPFADWQEGFLISEGRYSQAKPLSDGTLMLLDPFRAHLVFQKANSSYRWGRWGTRNGSLMFAKSITTISDQVVAISDVGLKLVFLYDREGNYFGYVGRDGAEERFGYPLNIASNQDKLYVADYFGNRVTGLTIKALAKPLDAKNGEKTFDAKKSFAENNLFRHPETQKTYALVRCLNCHDGLEKFSLDKFNLDKKHHPVGVVQKTEVDLRLGEGRKMDCFTCHDTHHNSLSGVVTGQFGEERNLPKIPYMLRKPMKELCLTCHQDKESAEHNHVGLDSRKLQKFRVQVKSCSQCHQLHSAEPGLLRKTVSELCTSCHGATQKPKSHPFGIVQSDLRPKDTDVNCLSCHSVHDSEKALHFSRHKTKDSEASCLNCHKEKILLLGLNKHLTADPKRAARVKWADQTSFCVNCHSPHQEKRRASMICASCHEDRKNKSHDKKVDSVFAAANIAISPKVKLSNGWLSCSTCHDPHLPATNKSLLRPERALILPLCANVCHTAEGANERFEKYHSKYGSKFDLKRARQNKHGEEE